MRRGLNAGTIITLAIVVTTASAQNWPNFGGNAQRNGQNLEVAGPNDADLLWMNDDDFSIISWHPVVMDNRAFAIRESGFPQNNGPANDLLVAYDLETGDELWSDVVPYAGDPDEEWIAYIGAAHANRVYTARGGSGRTTPVYAHDAANGDILWDSDYETVAGPQDGFVIAPSGDILVGDFTNVVRISAVDGSTVWNQPRSCPVSGNCGVVLGNNAVYHDKPIPGGNAILKLDLETGDPLYESPPMAGFTAQNAPFVSPDGQTVYFARSQNNDAVDFLYAFHDDGTQFTQLWSRPIRWTTSHEHAISPDGSIYTFIDGEIEGQTEFVRLDPATGNVLDSAGVLALIADGNLSPRSAVDALGRVYVSNGWSNNPPTNGRVWAFSPDLSEMLFELTLNRPNSGGPSLGPVGTLVVADRTAVFAYRTIKTGDFDGDTLVTLDDFEAFLDCATGPEVLPDPSQPTTPTDCVDAFDFDNDADVDFADYQDFAQLFNGE